MAYLTTSPALHRPSLFLRATHALHALALKSEARRTTSELSELSDHLLNDIGVTRTSIPGAVHAATQLTIADLRNRSAL